MKSKSDIVQKTALIGNKVKGMIPGGGGAAGKSKDSIKRQEAQPNPLHAYKPTDSLEDDCQTEADIIKQTLREADARIAEESRIKNATEYWFCCVFESEEQKKEFIEKMGWDQLPMQGDKYFDGTAIARLHNIPLQKVILKREKGSPKSVFKKLIDNEII